MRPKKMIYIWKEDLKHPDAPHLPHKVEILRLDLDARRYEHIKPDSRWVKYQLVEVKKNKKKLRARAVSVKE